jgi:hypothetical protein
VKLIERIPIAILCLFLVLPFSSSSQKVDSKLLQGEWVSNGGDIIIFKKNSFFCGSLGAIFHPYDGFDKDGGIRIEEDVDYGVHYFQLTGDSLYHYYDNKHGTEKRYPIYITSLKDSISLNRNLLYPLASVIGYTNKFKTVSFVTQPSSSIHPHISLEISTNGDYTFCYGEKWLGVEYDTLVYTGIIPVHFINQLNYLLKSCEWANLHREYVKQKSDVGESTISFTNSDGATYSVSDYGLVAPEEILALMNYMYNISSLIHNTYLKKAIKK